MDKHRAVTAVLFATLGIAGLALLNLVFSPGYIWFYYGVYGILWWPLAVMISPRRAPVPFALAGSALTALFLAIVNLQNSPGHPWFLYALYPLAWWPVSLQLSSKCRSRELSIIGSVLTIAYLVTLNLLFTPQHPWFLYACYPFLWWPLVIFLGRRAGTLAFAALCSAVTILYYTLLNVLVSPGFPWAICVSFAVMWWPMTLYFAQRRRWVAYSFAGSLLTMVFLSALNFITTPHVPWVVYPAFAILWWPLTLVFARLKNWMAYSIAGALLFSVFMVVVNRITTPGIPWAVYPVFAILWWPLTMVFARLKNWMAYSIAGALLFSVFMVVVNRLTTPGIPWAVYPVFAVLWWPLTMIFRRTRNWFGYAVVATALTAFFFLVVNRITTPGILWAVYPIFAIFWWPLSVYFFWYRKRKLSQ